MSKKKGKPKIRVGKFYNVRDGSEKGHPGYVFNADYENSEYDSIVTGTTYRKGMISIHPTSEMVKDSYIRKHPFKGTRNDYGEEDYSKMSFDKDALIKAQEIKNKKYTFGNHYKKKYRIK